MLNDPFSRNRLPVDVVVESRDETAREARVRWIGQVAEDLLADRLPDPEARLFLAGALLAWLQNGGNLERRYFRTTKAKSHRTASAIWRQLRAHRDEREPR